MGREVQSFRSVRLGARVGGRDFARLRRRLYTGYVECLYGRNTSYNHDGHRGMHVLATILMHFHRVLLWRRLLSQKC